MIPFDLAEPTSLAAAIKLLDPDDPTIRPIAGGTALMLMMKAGVFNPEKLISLRKIESKYSSISAGADGLAHRRDDDAVGTLERSADVQKARAGHHPHLADAVERARPQCRDRRRRAGPRRSAHGSAAGADGARRDAHRDRPEGRAQARGRGPVLRLLRDRAGEERTDRRGPRSLAGSEEGRLLQGHHRLGRRLAGARRRRRHRRRRQCDQVGAPRRQRRDRQGDPAEIGGSRAHRQDRRRQAARARPARPRSATASSSPTCAARCPTSAN